MKFYKISFIWLLIALLAFCNVIEAKKHRKHTRSSTNSHATKSKTKTNWSSTTEMGRNGGQLATEEHGYYIKRTFLPYNASANNLANAAPPQSPPYLGIPIDWFPCEGEACTKANTAAISGNTAALLDGFLCDDDCTGPYEPICGKTASELAVFYNKCKLNVAKCRTHGLWLDVPFVECNKTYHNEIAYAERKFKSSPFFRNTKKTAVILKKHNDDSSEEDTMLDVALLALDKIGTQIAEAEAEAIDEAAETTVKGEVNAPLAKPVPEQQSVSVNKPEVESVVIVEAPVKEIVPVTKPVKVTTDVQKIAENSVNKPVEIVSSAKTMGLVVAKKTATNDIKPVVKN
ncbi:uncharacterized protein ImpL1 [Eurosta solidaginis]|uniref:uncharacterized protein ImpL1 n=1 Tax=Eurosta solidaginis TaxID=178769 RepID=UPI00353152FD